MLSLQSWCLMGALFGAAVLLKLYFNGPSCKISKNLTGKVVIVTGSNCGIGFYTALRMAELGASVIMATRDPSRAEPALAEIRRKVKSAQIEFIKLDLASLKSVREFVDTFKSKYNRLDILINNAGLSMAERTVTSDGFEMVFQVNYLGHFLLTHLLTDYLLKSAPSRIVNVSAIIQKHQRINWDDMMSTKNYNWTVPYGQSKLAQVIYANEFNKRYEQRGVKAVSLHPGVANSEFQRNIFKKFWIKAIIFLTYPILLFFAKTTVKGAQTTIYCALEDHEKLSGGNYYADCKIRKLANPVAFDDETGKKLWDRTVELLNLK